MTDEAIKTYETGAKRSDIDDVRFDLISPIALRRLAQTYAEGAAKYSDYNWRKGFPWSSTFNHVLNHINRYLAGDRSEDNLAHSVWGLMAIMDFETTHEEMDDLYFSPRNVEDRANQA